MIWGILYFIGTIICCGIILYVTNLTIDDPLVITAVISGLIWPIFLVLYVLYRLGHCVRLLLEKVIKTK